MKAIMVIPDEKKPALVWQDVSNISFGPAEVLVKIQATAVNRGDVINLQLFLD